LALEFMKPTAEGEAGMDADAAFERARKLQEKMAPELFRELFGGGEAGQTVEGDLLGAVGAGLGGVLGQTSLIARAAGAPFGPPDLRPTGVSALAESRTGISAERLTGMVRLAEEHPERMAEMLRQLPQNQQRNAVARMKARSPQVREALEALGL
jgi:hypothetical protein